MCYITRDMRHVTYDLSCHRWACRYCATERAQTQPRTCLIAKLNGSKKFSPKLVCFCERVEKGGCMLRRGGACANCVCRMYIPAVFCVSVACIFYVPTLCVCPMYILRAHLVCLSHVYSMCPLCVSVPCIFPLLSCMSVAYMCPLRYVMSHLTLVPVRSNS